MSRVMTIAMVLVTAVPSLCGAAFSGTDVVLPSVGRGPGSGSSDWYTTIWIFNPNQTAVDVRYDFYLRDQPNPTPHASATDTLQPQATLRYANAVETLFGISAFGAIRLTASDRVVVCSRIFRLDVETGEAEDASVGQFFAAVPVSFAIAAGQTTDILGVYQTDPREDSLYRYNFGFVEVGGSEATVRVRAFDETGNLVGQRDYTLGSHQPLQRNIRHLVPGVDSHNLRLRAEVVAGTGKVIVFGSGLANRSNDPATFEMSFDDTLLATGSGGLTEVEHDSSLAGTGTATDPLGIANAGVTLEHLQAQGTAWEDYVLASDGSQLEWKQDGLQLPFMDSVDVDRAALWIINRGGGAGLFVSTDLGSWTLTAGSEGNTGAIMGSHTGAHGRAGLFRNSSEFSVDPALHGVTEASYSTSAAVFGEAMAGVARGVAGVTRSTESGAHGVFGETMGNFGWASGVYGLSHGAAAIGVSGWNDGAGVGLYGVSVSGVGLVVKSGSGRLIEAWDNDPSNLRFRVENDGSVWADGTINPGGADFAELLPSGEHALEPGDLLAVAPDGRLVRTSERYQTTVVGVYSTRPGVVGDLDRHSPSQDKVPLAVVGIVPVKVCSENGLIVPGDLLTASSRPGVAMRAEDPPPGTVVGKALARLDGDEGVINLLVMLQ